MDGLSNKALGAWMALTKKDLYPEMHRSKNALHPMGEISDQDALS